MVRKTRAARVPAIDVMAFHTRYERNDLNYPEDCGRYLECSGGEGEVDRDLIVNREMFYTTK